MRMKLAVVGCQAQRSLVSEETSVLRYAAPYLGTFLITLCPEHVVLTSPQNSFVGAGQQTAQPGKRLLSKD